MFWRWGGGRCERDGLGLGLRMWWVEFVGEGGEEGGGEGWELVLGGRVEWMVGRGGECRDYFLTGLDETA